MKAMVLAMAASVGESAFAQWWRKAGEMIDVVIPLVLVTSSCVAWARLFSASYNKRAALAAFTRR